MPNSKTVLVTGGAGFLGSHLCARLLAQGSEVLCADNWNRRHAHITLVPVAHARCFP